VCQSQSPTPLLGYSFLDTALCAEKLVVEKKAAFAVRQGLAQPRPRKNCGILGMSSPAFSGVRFCVGQLPRFWRYVLRVRAMICDQTLSYRKERADVACLADPPLASVVTVVANRHLGWKEVTDSLTGLLDFLRLEKLPGHRLWMRGKDCGNTCFLHRSMWKQQRDFSKVVRLRTFRGSVRGGAVWVAQFNYGKLGNNHSVKIRDFLFRKYFHIVDLLSNIAPLRAPLRTSPWYTHHVVEAYTRYLDKLPCVYDGWEEVESKQPSQLWDDYIDGWTRYYSYRDFVRDFSK